MKITTPLFEAGLKCITKCFLRSLGETGTGNTYADWVRTQTESYRNAGMKDLMAGSADDQSIIGLTGMENLKTGQGREGGDILAPAETLADGV